MCSGCLYLSYTYSTHVTLVNGRYPTRSPHNGMYTVHMVVCMWCILPTPHPEWLQEEERPLIEQGMQEGYSLGDLLDLNCSAKSQHVQLSWLLNDQPVSLPLFLPLTSVIKWVLSSLGGWKASCSLCSLSPPPSQHICCHCSASPITWHSICTHQRTFSGFSDEWMNGNNDLPSQIGDRIEIGMHLKLWEEDGRIHFKSSDTLAEWRIQPWTHWWSSSGIGCQWDSILLFFFTCFRFTCNLATLIHMLISSLYTQTVDCIASGLYPYGLLFILTITWCCPLLI